MANFQKTIIILLTMGMLTYMGCKEEEEVQPQSQEAGPDPAIENVSPGEGSIGTEITISGADFESDASVYIGEEKVDTMEISNSSTIYALVPDGIATNTLLSVSVDNPNGGQDTLNDAYKAVDPALNYVNSATKPSGNVGSTVILEGKAFGDLQGNGKILFSDGAGGTIEASIDSAEDWTETFIVTTVPSGAEDGPLVVETAVGTSNALDFKVTDNANFSPSNINWTKTSSLPVAVSGHNAQYVPVEDQNGDIMRYVYVTGGRDSDSVALDQAVSGKINTDGTISAWDNTTTMSDSIAFHASIAATPFNSKVNGSGYLYTLGGMNNSGEVVNTVALAPINNDGTLETWSTTTSLPEPLHSLGVVIFRNAIYIAGGATADNTPVEKVYKATIDSTGALNEWEELTSLPTARAYHGLVTFGRYLYTVGGEEGSETPDDGNFKSNDTKLAEVAYAKINLRSGDLDQTDWRINENSLQKSRNKHTLLALGGNLFVTSGLYSAAGQGSSENTFAQINSDGTVGSFGGATGDNTLLSEGGSNLFNQSGISYIDADGVGHIMILGGDDVNSPGNKRANVLFY